MAPVTLQLELSLAWLRAVAAGDEAELQALSDDDIMLIGMKGLSAAPAAKGHAALRRWLGMTRIAIEPTEAFVEAGRVLVMHRMRWLDGAGEPLRSASNASLLQVGSDGRIASYLIDHSPDPVARQGFRGTPAIALTGKAA